MAPGGNCGYGVKMVGHSSPSMLSDLVSPTTPTISATRVPAARSIASRPPTAPPPGQKRRASVWLTTATGADCAVSESVTARPAKRGIPMATKYPGVMERERSEEHTSELQSLRHLVCRLLLEK